MGNIKMRLHTHSKGGGQLLHAKGLGEKKKFFTFAREA